METLNANPQTSQPTTTTAPASDKRGEYRTRSVRRRSFGRNNYVAVSRKELVIDGAVVQSFIVIERGWTTASGTDKCTRFVTVPDSPNELNFVREALDALMLAHELADGAANHDDEASA